MNTNYTLLDILTNNIVIDEKHLVIDNGIEIPMIQRDYAQGRDDEKTSYIREHFLKDIYSVFKENQEGINTQLNLDFIYGYIENSTFIPLDGQQRLTTLYIIYWFIAFKDKIVFSDYGLHQFNYKTRQSAKEFLKSLTNNENVEKLFVEIENSVENLVINIKNQPWYNLNWDYDPTVKGFLQTLEEVSKLFSDITFNTIIENNSVNFHFLQINEYGLGDNLYIKMNARGKPLSNFENFKASFESIIFPHSSAKNFVDKIDGKWSDAFWEFSVKSLEKVEIEHGHVSEFSAKCDELMLNSIIKITEYLHYTENSNKEFQFNHIYIEQIYSHEENLLLLIQILDFISDLNYLEWQIYFDNIFSEKFTSGKIAINQQPLNPIIKIFNNDSFSHFENILFFGWLNFITRSESLEISSDLKDFLRIIRNYINNVNQKNKTSLDSELRVDYYHNILKTVSALPLSDCYKNLGILMVEFRKDYIEYETDKYNVFLEDANRKELIFKFEDFSSLKGLIYNFDFTPYNNKEIENIVDNFYGLYQRVPDKKDIVRFILCFGDYSVTVGDSNLGEFKFLGETGKWHRILASREGEIATNFIEIFKIFSTEKILDWETFIENHVSQSINNYNDSWLWYGMNSKYKDILKYRIYTINDKSKVEIFYTQNLNSYHFNPFVYWFRFYSPQQVKNQLNLEKSCAQYSNFSALHLKNSVYLKQREKSWLIYNLNGNINHSSFQYDEENGIHILTCNDLIEDLIPLIAMLNNEKPKMEIE